MSFFFWEICKGNQASRYSIRRLFHYLVYRCIALLHTRKLRSLSDREQAKLMEAFHSGELLSEVNRHEAVDTPFQISLYQDRVDQMARWNPVKRNRQILLACEVKHAKALWIARSPVDERTARETTLTDTEKAVVDAICREDKGLAITWGRISSFEDFIRVMTRPMYKWKVCHLRRLIREDLSKVETDQISLICKADLDQMMKMSDEVRSWDPYTS